MTKPQDPWDRDQIGQIGDGFIEVDGIALPGVLAREVKVQYIEDEKSEWPILVTVSFYLDELSVDPTMVKHVEFSQVLTGPKDDDDE